MTFNQMSSQSAPMAGRRQSPAAFDMSAVAGVLPEYQNLTSPHSLSFESPSHYAQPPSVVPGYQNSQFQVRSNTGSYPVTSPHFFPFNPDQASSGHPGFNASQSAPQTQTAGGHVPTSYTNVFYPGQQHRPAQLSQYLPFAGQYASPIQPPYQSHIPPGSGAAFGQHFGEIGTRSTRDGYQTSSFPVTHPGHFWRSGNSHGEIGFSNFCFFSSDEQ